MKTVLPRPLWNVSDDAQLAELAGKGLSAEEIARTLSRSESAVRNRAKRLRLKLRKEKVPRDKAAVLQSPAAGWKPAMGDRVRLSELGRRRNPRMQDVPGTIVSGLRLLSRVGVLFDGRKYHILMHIGYLESVGSE